MITLTQSEGRQIKQVAEGLLKKELPTSIVIEIMKRYNSIDSQLDDENPETEIQLDFPQFPMSLLSKEMPRITGVFLVGAMGKLFDFDN
jgi:hypothetical protein